MDNHGLTDRWPDAGNELMAELDAARGRVALVADGPDMPATTAAFTELLGVEPTDVGLALTQNDELPSGSAIEAMLVDSRVLTNLHVLFWPDLATDPLALLRNLAYRHSLVAVWPGGLRNGRATYSEPGRPDAYDEDLSDVLVLHPIPVRYPDDIPYTLERVPR